MKVQIGHLVNTFAQLVEFANLDMAPALAFRLKRIVKDAKKELESYGEVEKEAAEKYNGVLNVVDGGGSFFKFASPEKQQEYVAALEEARKLEIDLSGTPFTEKDLVGMTKVKASLLTDLDWLITD